MTVICTLISKFSTVHVTDSHVTQQVGPNSLKVTENKQPKLVHVPKFKGAFSYFGLATAGTFSTFDWLTEKAKDANGWDDKHPEKFAEFITTKLNEEFTKLGLHGKIEAGIGIHFTSYEVVGSDPVPEMFFITNWRGGYVAAAPAIIMQRQTYHTVKGNIGPQPEHRDLAYRMEVLKHLNEGKVIMYNNGDPELFNSAAYALFNMIEKLTFFKAVDITNPIEHFDKLALLPVQTVGAVQKEFCRTDFRPVGGDTHIITIQPDGAFSQRAIPEQASILRT